MADPFQPVRQGSPLSVSARSFNGLLKAGQDFSRRKLDEGRPPPRDGSGINPVFPPQIYNGLTAALDEFAVLGFDAAQTIDTAAAPFEASSSPIFTAALPDSSLPFCITREPVPVGAIGQIVTNGPAVVRVEITDATHARAVPITGDTSKLTSAASGGVPILDRETGTGTKWAKVLLGGSAGGLSAIGTDPDITFSGTPGAYATIAENLNAGTYLVISQLSFKNLGGSNSTFFAGVASWIGASPGVVTFYNSMQLIIAPSGSFPVAHMAMIPVLSGYSVGIVVAYSTGPNPTFAMKQGVCIPGSLSV